MESIKTLGECIPQLPKVNAQGVLREKRVFSKPLQSDSEYAFCPICTKRARKNQSENWREFSTHLIYQNWKYAIPSANGTVTFGYDKKWYCPTCKITFTQEQIAKHWTGSPEPTPKVVKFEDWEKYF